MTAQPTEQLRAIRVRRNPWVIAASFIPWAAIPLLFLASAITGDRLGLIPVYLAIAGALLFPWVWQKRPFDLHDEVTIRVTETELRLGDAVIPRSCIEKAEILPGRARPNVRVVLRRRPAEHLVMQDDASAHAFLTALGVEPSQATATYRIGSLGHVRYRWTPFAFFLLLFLLTWVSKAWVLPGRSAILPLAWLFYFVALVQVPGSVVVGVDGVLLRWLWVREFYATKDIHCVSPFSEGWGRSRVSGVELTMKNGRSVKLPISDDEAWMLQKRIADVMALARSSDHVQDDALLLSRGDLELRDWIARLKSLGAGATATLRVAPVMPDRLWRVAQDPAQAPAARAAAAVALSPTLDESGRARLVQIAKATAAPKLRVALERVATAASEEELAEALGALEA